jgi:hypothetical protein
MVLISFELSLPLSWASWMVKVNVRANMSYMLDKSQVENLMPLEYEYLNLTLLNLGPK